MNQKLFDSRRDRLRDATIVGIFRMKAPDHVVEAAAAAVRGGFEAVEVTLNTPGATDALSELAGRVDALVGAGTIVHVDQVKEAYDSGAEFIVTPVGVPDVVEAAHSLSLPIAVGASTPTEVWNAREAGADWVKVFPAESLGGPSYIESLLGPLDDTPILVSGGITAENYMGYLDVGVQIIGIGAPVFDPLVAADGDYPELERRAIEVMRRFDLYQTDHD